MDACRNVWRAAINSLYKVCLQCSGKQSLHHACSQAVIPDPDPAAASFTPHMVTSQEIQPTQTSHSKAKSCSNLIHITSYVIPNIHPKEKDVHKVSISLERLSRWCWRKCHGSASLHAGRVGKWPQMGTTWNRPMSPPSLAWRNLWDFSASAPQCLEGRLII